VNPKADATGCLVDRSVRIFERVNGRILGASITVLAAWPKLACEIRTTTNECRMEWGINDRWPTPPEALLATLRIYSANSDYPTAG